MRRKKRLVISLVLVFFIFGVSLPLFITNHRKVKADTITNLTGTTWVFNNSINFFYWSNRFYINFTSNNTNYIQLYMLDDEERNIYYYTSSNSVGVYYDGWQNDNYKTITITGGNDVTNSTLISWLQDNATQEQPTPPGTEITHRYWAPMGVITMTNNQVVSDEEITYTILFNEQRRQYDETTQTGLIFKGLQTNQEPIKSYIESINGSGINILYMGDTNNINNSMWLEFTIGDYIDDDLYDFLSLWGVWFDDANAYLVGANQGYVEGKEVGRALGQADGTQYTTLVTSILNGIGGLLNIQVFPNITIALIIGLPLLLGVLAVVLKILRS